MSFLTYLNHVYKIWQLKKFLKIFFVFGVFFQRIIEFAMYNLLNFATRKGWSKLMEMHTSEITN